MWRDERFTANQTGDSIFVARTTHQIIAVGVQPESNVAPPDSFSQMVINVKKTPKANIIDTITIYYDADSNAFYSPGDQALSTISGGIVNGETAQYAFYPARVMAGGTETFVINLTFNQNLATGDTVQIIFIKDGSASGYSQLYIYNPSAAVGVPSAANGDTNSLLYTARIDSTQVSINPLSDTVIHPDSRVGMNPFTILSGTVFGETRGLTADRLRTIGVGFGGSARDSVVSAWVLLFGTDTINLTRVGADSWNSSAIDSALAVDRTGTFVVKIRLADTTAVNSTIFAYIPKDSVTTMIRPSGPTANSDSSAVFTVMKPDVILASDSLGNLTIHPDSRAVGGNIGSLAASGTLVADTMTSITNDVVETFGVSLILTGGMLSTDIDSVAVEIDGDTRTLTQDGATDSWVGTINKAINGAATYKVWVRAYANTPQDATLTALIMTDSITTTFRNSGPKSVVTSNRTITYKKPDIILNIDNLGDIFAHRDSTTGDGALGVKVASGQILADTVTGVTGDTLNFAGVYLEFGGGMAAANVDSVAIELNGDTAAMIQDGATDTWYFATPVGFTGTSNYAVYVRAHDNTPLGSTVKAIISQDSTFTEFRNQGPESTAYPNRTVTYINPSGFLIATNLGNTSTHPDSRAANGFDGILTCSATLVADTLTRISADIIDTFGVYLTFSAGMSSANIDSISVVIDNDTRTLTKQADNSWLGIALNKSITDSADIQVFVRVHANTPSGETLAVVIQPDSMEFKYRSVGPKDTVSSLRDVTFIKQDIILVTDNLGAVASHPDSQVAYGPLGILAASGAISADSVSNITNDNVLNFGVSLLFGNGMDSTYIDSVAVEINGDTQTMNEDATKDSWYLTLNKAITDTAYYKIYVRAHSTTPNNGQCTAIITVDSLATDFRNPGPKSMATSDRTIIYTKQEVILTPEVLTDLTIHPDIRVNTTPVGVLVASGALNADSYTGITNDNLLNFGVSLVMAGMTATDIDSVSVEIDGDTRTLSQDGATDSWVGTINKAISDTAYYKVYVRTLSTTPSGSTLKAWIMTDSVATQYRDPGPASPVTSGRIVTFERQDVQLILDPLTNVTINPDSRAVGDSLGVLVLSATLEADSMTGITADTINYVGVTFTFAGMTSANIESVAIELNGDTITATKVAGVDTWFVTGIKNISDTAYIRVYARSTKNTPDNGTLVANISTDSVWTDLRDSGPNSLLTSSRTVTYYTPSPEFVADSLGNVSAHPDSNVTGGIIGVLVAQGIIAQDTISGVSGDVVETFGISLNMTGMTSANIESVALVINEDTQPMAKISTADSWEVVLNKSVTDTIYYRVYVRARETTNSGSTLSALIMPDSVALRYRDLGPAVFISSSRTVTYDRQDVILEVDVLTDTQLHPDSSIAGGIHGTKVFSGRLMADTFTGIVNDVIDTVGVSLILTGGIASNLESVSVVINGDTRTMTKEGAVDSWFATVNKPISDTASIEIWVRVHDNILLGSTITARIMVDSIITTYRARGPKSVATSGRILTETKPILQLPSQIINNGMDTILPQWAIVNPVTVLKGKVLLDTTLIYGDTDIITELTVEFGGSAGDSVYNAQFSIKTNGAWTAMNKVAGWDTRWQATGLSIQVSSNDTYGVRINVADTVTLGTLLYCSYVERGCTSVYSTPGPGVLANDSSATFMMGVDSVIVIMDYLGDTTIPPWNALLSNPIKVCTGHIYIDRGSTPMLDYDSLTSFGISFDTVTTDIANNNSIETVVLYLTPSLIVTAGDTKYLTQDGADTLWKLADADSKTLIGNSQGFEIWVTLKSYFADSRILVSDSFFARIPKDSVNTYYTSGLAGETHSSRTVSFYYADTTYLVMDGSLTDTNVNPDSMAGDIPFDIYAGTVNGISGYQQIGSAAGQQYYAPATDSITYFSVALFSAATSDVTVADSITSAAVYFGPNEDSYVLTAGASYFDEFGSRVKPYSINGINQKMSSDNNSETFIVRGWVAETVALGTNSRVRAFMHADSVHTFFMGDSSPSEVLLGSRIVTFTKAPFVITATALTDIIVSPFRDQNDSTLVFDGKITSSQSPSDSLTTFQVKVISNNIVDDSIVLKVEFLAGSMTPASEQTLSVDTPGLNPVFKLAAPITIDSGQSFRIRVLTATEPTKLIGETLSVQIETAVASYSVGTVTGVTSGRIVRFNYVDTLVITDSALTAVTIHPDSRLNQNPFIAYIGTFDGQTSASGVSDTLQRVGFQFVGTAVSGRDSVQSAYVILNSAGSEDTLSLIRNGSDNWSLSLDSTIAYNSTITCTLYVQVFETVALGATLQATIPQDSVSTRLQTDTSLFTASRIVTFNKPRMAITPDALINVSVHPDSRITGQPVLIASGQILADTTLSSTLTYDTVTSFGVSLNFVSMAYTDVESVALDINGETFAMARDGADSWFIAVTKQIADSANYKVYVNVRETTAQNATLTALIMPDSVTSQFRQSGPASVISSGRVVTFGRPGVQAEMTPIASQTIHPVLTQGQNPTTILSGTIQGESSTLIGDTLQVFQINIRGTSKDSVTSCTLVIGPGLETAVLTKIDTTASGDTWLANMNYGFKAIDLTSDTFSVVILTNEFVNQNGTVQAYIPTRGLKTLFADTGASSDTTSGATLTYQRGNMRIISEPRDAGFPSAIQALDTHEVMWFRAQVSDTVEADTINALTVNLYGSSDPTKFLNVYLVRDLNENQKFDTTPADYIVGSFTNVSGETWTIDLAGLPTQTPTDTIGQETTYSSSTRETSQYLIVIRLADTSYPSVRCRVPVGGADGPFSEPNVSAVLYDSYTIITPDTNPPLPPINFTVTVNAGSLEITFGPSPSGDTQMTNGQYNLYWDSGVGTYPDTLLSAVPHVSGQTSYSYSLSNLIADHEYRFSVKAQDQAGNQGNATMVVSAVFRSATSPAPLATVTLLQPSAGDHIYYDTTIGAGKVSLIAELISGSSSDVTGVVFYVRPITGGNWSTIGTATDSSYDNVGNVYYSINYDTSILVNDTTLEFRAVAQTAQGLDTYAVSLSATTTNDTATAQYVMIAGTSTANDSTYVEAVVSTKSTSDLIIIRTPTGAFDVVVTLHQGSISNDTDRAVVRAQHGSQSDTLQNACKRAATLIPEYWAEISLISGQTNLGGQGATITVNYIDANGDGIDDSTSVDMSKAKIYTVTAAGLLEELQDITWNKARRTLSGRTTHFSPIFVTNATGDANAGLNRLIVGPNPYRPNDGNDQTGKPWISGDATTGIIFKNLPVNSKIEIYTILGEKVTEFTNGANGATASWSVKNDDNREVASGYYLYIVTDPASGQRVTGKVAVIR